MGRPQYPNGSDLEAYLIAAGLAQAFVAELDTETAAAAGVAQFEHEAGRRMLAVTQTREFDPYRVNPSNGFLDLRADLATLTSVAWASSTYTVGTDVRPYPLNAADDGLPYSGLTFGLWRRFGSGYPLPSLLTVVGAWGYGTTIPEDAWLSMLAYAAQYLFPQILHQRTGGMEMWSEADMTERYGTKPLEALRLGWQALTLGTAGGLTEQGKRVWGKYARVPMG